MLSPSPWFKDVVPNVSSLTGTQSFPYSPSLSSSEYFLTISLVLGSILPHASPLCVSTQPYTFPGSSHSGSKAGLFLNVLFVSTSRMPPLLVFTHQTRLISWLTVPASWLLNLLAVVPARGQVVVVRNKASKMLDASGTDDGDGEACSVMTRAAGGGTILGGCYQKGNWESQVDPSLAVRIMKRAVTVCPVLTGGKRIEHLDIVRHSVGLRPVRDGGMRIEKERIGDIWVVHNYGAGGAGYQSSYGCAQAAVDLIDEVFEKRAML